MPIPLGSCTMVRRTQELLVVDLVVELGRLHMAQVECNWVDVAIIGEDLGDDCCNHIIRSISFNNNRIIRVEMCQDGCLASVKAFLKISNALVWSGPHENRVSFQVRQIRGMTMSVKPNNELEVEVGKA